VLSRKVRMIRKGRLHRNCIECGEKFEPFGRRHRMYDVCQAKSHQRGNIKRIENASAVQKRHLHFLSRIRNYRGRVI